MANDMGAEHMKLDQVFAFIAVASEGSFTKASVKMYLSQPTISRYINELEKEIGVELFIRGKKTCVLTPAGEKAYEHAMRITHEWELMRDEARIVSQGTRTALRIGYSYNEMLPMISLALSRNEIIRTNIDLSMRFGEGERLAQMVRSNELDCAVVHLPSIVHTQQLSIRTIRECDMCILVHKDSPLARFSRIKTADLAGQTDVRVRDEVPFYQAADDALKKKGIGPINHVYVSNSDECKPIAATTGYFCLTPSIYPAWPDCKLIPVVDWSVPYPLVFITSHVRSPIVDTLYSILKENI